MLGATVRINRLGDLLPETRTRLKALGWREEAGLAVGAKVKACAFGFWDGLAWLYVVGPDSWPSIYPAECFALENVDISDLWGLGVGQNDFASYWFCPRLFMIPTFEDFYERLVNDDAECLAIYQRFKLANGVG